MLNRPAASESAVAAVGDLHWQAETVESCASFARPAI